MKKDTLMTIAERTGYSVSTVSRVVSGNAEKCRISAAAAERIMAEVREGNYIPNTLAKGLRTSKTDTIGLVLPNIENVFYAKIASIVMRQVHSFGYHVMVIDTLDDLQNETDALTALLSQKVDGIIAVPTLSGSSLYEDTDVPVVFLYRNVPQMSSIPYVSADNHAGAVLAFEHLLENGHKDILCVQGNPDSMSNKDRVRGIKDTIKAHKAAVGLSGSVRISGNAFTVENGYEETRRALTSRKVPTAIFALDGNILMGVIRAIKECGKKIPKDISVVAIDDNEDFNYLDPAITCVRQPSEELGSLSVGMLMDIIQSGGLALDSALGNASGTASPSAGNASGTADPYHLFLAPTLVLRNSVRKIGKPL